MSQYPPKNAYLQNENNLISVIKNHIVRLENKILFLKKEMKTKTQLISTLISTQQLTQKQSLWKQLNPDCENLNEINKIKMNVVHNTGDQTTYTDIPSSSTTENTVQCNNAQNIEENTNTQNETTNMINLNLSNIAKCELVIENTCYTKSNPYIQLSKHNSLHLS